MSVPEAEAPAMRREVKIAMPEGSGPSDVSDPPLMRSTRSLKRFDTFRGGHRHSLMALRPVGDGDEEEPLGTMIVYDEMTYKPDGLLGMQALFWPTKWAIWSSGSLWFAMLKLATLSLLVAVITVLTVPDPGALKVEVFADISKFLSVFCGLVLGFFLTTSVKRWHQCAQGFLELCDAIRNLQMQFHALGVSDEKCNMCIRYGILSGWLLKNHLEAEAADTDGQTTAREYTQESWDALTAQDDNVELGIKPKFLPCELAVLRKVKDPAAGMWTWISSLIGRMAQDGEIPAMQTPTYGRIMNIAQDAHSGIRQVRSSISVRAPFVYVQMLTSLVHVNNILNAINLGIVTGVAISGAMIRHNVHYFHPYIRGNQSERDVQFFAITILICALGPLLYHALIEISVCLAVPFAAEFGKIPIDRLMLMLEEDLRDGASMSGACPKWQKASFKQ